MVPCQLILSVAEKGLSLYDAQELKRIIHEIWSTLQGIYTDVANAQFAAAQSAFAAAKQSHSPKQEVRDGNAHLRAAYYTYEALLTKTRSQRVLLFLHEEVPLLDASQKTQVKGCMFEIAACIAVNYADLREPGNASAWKQEAVKHLDDHVDARTAHLTGEFLYRHVNKEYVRAETHKSYGGGGLAAGYISYNSWTSYDLNDRGDKYVAEQKKHVRGIANAIFTTKKIR